MSLLPVQWGIAGSEKSTWTNQSPREPCLPSWLRGRSSQSYKFKSVRGRAESGGPGERE